MNNRKNVGTTRGSNPVSFFKGDSYLASQLLKMVMNADYKAAAQLADFDPSLMFKKVHITYANNTKEIISPLMYAFKVLDTHMWKIFEQKIKDKNPELMTLFNQQMHEKISRPPYETLIKEAYDHFEAQRRLWATKKLDVSQLDQEWLAFANWHRTVLPTHMLKEYCRKGNTWHPNATFDQPEPPMECEAYAYGSGGECYIPLLSNNSGFGTVFGISRGMGPGRWHAEVTHASWVAVPKGDDDIFCRLLEIRKRDLLERQKQSEMQFNQELSVPRAKL